MYKRAAIFIYLLSVCLCSCMQRYETVSYTHLDVYKRQEFFVRLERHP